MRLIRDDFGKLLAGRNRHGRLAEQIDPGCGEHWGNLAQTYKMVGPINPPSACRSARITPFDRGEQQLG